MRPGDAEIEHLLQTIGHEAFPDDTDVRWTLRGVIERGGYICAEAAPVPATVGYPQFRFVLRPEAGGLVDHGCYCLEGDNWRLLYTTPGTQDDWKTLAFDKAA